MGKVLQHPLRSIGAALTLVGAAVVFVVLFVPIAVGGNPSGKNEVRFYENSKGSKTKKVGQDQLFTVVGKNFGTDTGHVVNVYCWDGVTDAGVTGLPVGWAPVTAYGTTSDSKHIFDVDAANTCTGLEDGSRILVQFNVAEPEFVTGPRLAIT